MGLFAFLSKKPKAKSETGKEDVGEKVRNMMTADRIDGGMSDQARK